MKSKFISLGVQNCHYHREYGPFTGSVNASMLKKAGAEYIILGHSENRKEGETDALIKKKIISAYNQKLKIIYCIGETLKEKRDGKTFYVMKRQKIKCTTIKQWVQKARHTQALRGDVITHKFF